MDTLFSIKLEIPVFDLDREINFLLEVGPYLSSLEALNIMMNHIDFILKLHNIPYSLLIRDKHIKASIQEYTYIDGIIEELPSTIIEYIETNNLID